MISNYFKIALRNILKRKGYSLINIIGLAIGMSCFVLISFLVWDEFSFDRFNEHAGRIYRLTLDAQVGEKLFLTAKSSGPLSRSLRNCARSGGGNEDPRRR
jgi:putative ABC transport system permease protein